MSDDDQRTAEVRDLLRISPREAAALLRELDGQGRRVSKSHEKRERPRFRFQHIPRLVVCLMDGDLGLENYYVMVPRNISETGVALLHGQFVHPGSICVVNMKTLDGDLVRTKGTVAQCHPVSGRVHELGVRFDHPVDLSHLLPLEQAA